MLSDEEKKAIDKLKRSANYFVMPIYETKIILELIEKQSKEIEKLKNKMIIFPKDYKPIGSKGRRFISEDKIKAKIEELKKENEQNRKDLERAINFSIFNNIREKIFINMCIKDTLKSLLEKE